MVGDLNGLMSGVETGVAEVGATLEAIARDDLTRRVEGDYAGAFDRLKQHTNAVTARLTEILAQLRQTSRGVKTATGEILTGANDLSERTTRAGGDDRRDLGRHGAACPYGNGERQARRLRQ